MKLYFKLFLIFRMGVGGNVTSLEIGVNNATRFCLGRFFNEFLVAVVHGDFTALPCVRIVGANFSPDFYDFIGNLHPFRFDYHVRRVEIFGV